MIIYAGWNMVSSNGYSDPIGQFFGEYSDNITVMWKYVPGSGYSLVTKNDNFEQGVGYWLKSNLQFNYDITGLIVTSPLEITWIKGWNMMSTPFNEPIILANMSWESNIVVIWKYVPGSGYVLVQKTDALEPGRAYWIKFDTTVTETFIATTEPEQEPEQEPEPEPEPEPYPLDVIIKVEFTESLSFVKGQYIQDASGIGVLDKDGNGNLIMGTPAPTDPPTPAIIISAKSGNEINKNMTGFLFNFNKDTTKITNGVSSNSPSSGQDPYCLEYYNVQNVSDFQIEYKPIFNFSIVENLNGEGVINGYTSNENDYISLTSEYQELMVIPFEYAVDLDSLEIVSDDNSQLFSVSIEYEGPQTIPEIIIKSEFTESLSFVKGQYLPGLGGIGCLDQDDSGNLIMGTPHITTPATKAIIISAKSSDDTEKTFNGFLFDFSGNTTKLTNGVSSSNPSSGQDPYCLEYYNVQNVSNQQILFKPIFNYSITNNLNGAGAISGFSTSSFINLTSEFQELMVIPSDYFMSLEKIELTSPPPSGEDAPPQAPGNPSRMYNVVIEYEGPILE
tara:strand:+ start:638 stop:2320 length:1683 start_codon:yes stop_codon:yes gene_type:complete